MIKTLLILTIMLITGCAPSKLEINVANYICKDRGGVFKLYSVAIENKVILCNDNTRHDPHGVVIPKEYLHE